MGDKLVRTLLLATAMAMCLVPSAWACRTVVPNASELTRHNHLVLASIEAAERIERRGWNTWRLRTRTLQTIGGSTSAPEHMFLTTQSSDGCGVTPLPTKGAKWVIYYDPSAPDQVLEAFPVTLARGHDHRLADVR
jgi:hypothetical protein